MINSCRLVVGAADGHDEAFAKVSVQPQGDTGDREKLAHRGKIIRVDVSEENHIVCIERDSTGHVSRSKTS